MSLAGPKGNPLEHPPADSEVLARFIHHFALPQARPTPQYLALLVRAFARLPYENLTKIIKKESEGAAARARRDPGEVVGGHIAWGAGGTCFSLTAALLHLLRASGWAAEPILADRPYGPNTHCALVASLDGIPHLLDPGFLILEPRQEGAGWDLFTKDQGGRRLRLTFKSGPADAGEFLKAWDGSFEWDGMRYPVLTQVRQGRQIYLQGRRRQVRDRKGVQKGQLDPEREVEAISADFGLHPSVVGKALAILKRQGEGHA